MEMENMKTFSKEVGACALPRFLSFAMILVAALLVADVPLVAGYTNNSSKIDEVTTLNVMCDQASLSLLLSISSENYTLIHFPNEVDMFDSHLENTVEVMVGRTPSFIEGTFVTLLDYRFNNIGPEEARINADAVTPSMSAAFGVSFTWMGTNTSNTQVEVSYTASGLSDLTSFAELLASTCVAEDVDGLSNCLSYTPAFTVGVVAYKDAGSFNWTTSITAAHLSISIPTGSNSHTIDVLDLLGVSSLAPSPYSFDDSLGAYTSTTVLTITSSNPISFVSCEPPLTSTPGEKGWANQTQVLPSYLWTKFSFGNDPSPVTQLSYTFSGTIIPEFTSLTLILTLMLAAASVFLLKKRLRQIK
ncbi:MAG: hypothetical protein NWE80_00585 [Candidatus Bathyarchaeota archaeon]|nr:hypothetical protein [Candidatus Bathyarchaeota archaeon]